VLDIGTGTGIVTLEVARKLGEQGEVVGIDLSDGMLATAIGKAEKEGLAGKAQFLKMDAEALEFDANSFDCVLSLYALRYFPNPEKAVAEIRRVLKPGGKAVIAVGSRPELLSKDGVAVVVRKIGSVIRRLTGRELAACEFLDELVNKHIPESANSETAGWTGHRHGFTGSCKRPARGGRLHRYQQQLARAIFGFRVARSFLGTANDLFQPRPQTYWAGRGVRRSRIEKRVYIDLRKCSGKEGEAGLSVRGGHYLSGKSLMGSKSTVRALMAPGGRAE
jgi:SAM-dependent methyltransferase